MFSAFLPDQEVQAHISNFEVDYDGETTGTIKVKLTKAVNSPVFYLNGKLITPESSTAYEFKNVKDKLKLNEENVFTVTDSEKTFTETKNFICKDLIAPQNVTIAATNTSEAGKINASNVKNASILVTFPAETPNTGAVVVTAKLTGKDADGNPKELTLSKEIENSETQVRFDGLDLSGFAEGTLTLVAEVKDNQGNIAKPKDPTTITKRAEAPMLKDLTVERSIATSAKITLYQKD